MPSRTRAERVFDCLLAASLLGWALLGLLETGVNSVRVAIAALNVTVACSLVTRATAEKGPSAQDVLRSVPALACAGLALRLAAPLNEWPVPARALFLLGSLLAIRSLVSLGKSFAVLPARKKVVVEGPYRLVRHPVYAGELMMLLACFFARPVVASAALVLVALPFWALRIGTEERLLEACEEYRGYRRDVRWRLVPWLW